MLGPQEIRSFHKECGNCKSIERRDFTREETIPIHEYGNCKNYGRCNLKENKLVSCFAVM